MNCWTCAHLGAQLRLCRLLEHPAVRTPTKMVAYFDARLAAHQAAH